MASSLGCQMENMEAGDCLRARRRQIRRAPRTAMRKMNTNVMAFSAASAVVVRMVALSCSLVPPMEVIPAAAYAISADHNVANTLITTMARNARPAKRSARLRLALKRACQW